MSSDGIKWNIFMVKIRDMTFSYDIFKKGKNILENINMSFPKSTMYAKERYGLLGPSGCGKTSLLKLILGLKKPNSGTIRVMGRLPSDPLNRIPGPGVGFQPQELALYGEFTICQSIQYFCQIYGMLSKLTEKKIRFLVKLLELPDPNQRVKQLSGGQQRRVSLAVAIAHNPPLLILDEPTVGLDPLLREKIWDHLSRMCAKNGTSILITTHYIGEAQRAHVIALMRSGTLLIEQTPTYLMDYFKVQELEEVFLKICEVQQSSSKEKTMPKSFTETMDMTLVTESDTYSLKSSLFDERLSYQDLQNPTFGAKFCALIYKDYIRITRDILMLTFQLLTPAFSIILCLLCIGELPTDMPVGFYNGELTNEKIEPNFCDFENMGKQYLELIKNLKLEPYQSIESAKEAVKVGDIYGTLIIDENFSENLCKRFEANATEVKKSNIIYAGDLTDIIIHTTIYKELSVAQVKFVEYATQKIDNKTDIPPEAFKPLLEIVPPIYGTLNFTFKDFMTPGMTIAVMFILAVGLTALSFVTEKKEGIMDRTLMAGATIWEILVAQLILQIGVLIIQIIILMLILFWGFQSKNDGSYELIFLIILFQGVVGMTYGYVISILAPDEQSAIMMAFGTFFPLLLLSGVFWPIEGMPYAFQLISNFMPQTHAVMTMRYIMFKGWDLTETYIWLGFLTTTLWFFILVSASVLLTTYLG